MRVRSGWTVAASFAVLAVANAMILGAAAWNRSGGPRLQIELTEREVALPLHREQEDTGIVLSLVTSDRPPAIVEAFDRMLAKYPASDKAAAANLKKALAFVQLNQIGQGVEQLRYVVATYPGTDEARIAKDRLAALGKP